MKPTFKAAAKVVENGYFHPMRKFPIDMQDQSQTVLLVDFQKNKNKGDSRLNAVAMGV